MANSNLTPSVVTKEALDILHNNIVFCRNVNRQYDDSNELGGQKNGGSVKIRLPNKYTTSTGAALDVQDNVEQSVTISQTTQRHVDLNFTTQELTLDIDTFSERIIEPAVSVLAAMFDYDVMAETLKIGNSVGTPGTTPSSAANLLESQKYLNYFATPQSRRYGCVNEDANAALVAGASNIYNTTGKGDDQYKSGLIANNQLGFQELNMTQSVRTHTTGTRALADSTVMNETVAVEGQATLDVNGGTTTATITAGDVFTVAGVYSVNPETKQSTGKLMQFVCLALNTASTGAWTDISVYPAMYTSASKGLQNIDAFPASGAVVAFVGAEGTQYPQNITFHKDTFVVATTDLEMPEGVHFSAREVMDGISMRCVRQYRIGTDDIPTRIDILYGSVTARGETGCRTWG